MTFLGRILSVLTVVCALPCGLAWLHCTNPSQPQHEPDFTGRWVRSRYEICTRTSSGLTVQSTGVIDSAADPSYWADYCGLVVSPSQYFFGAIGLTHCESTPFPMYRISDSKMVPVRYWSSVLFSEDSSYGVIREPDTLIWYDFAYYYQRVMVSYYVKRSDQIPDSLDCPTTQLETPTCTDYGCDTKMPLVFALWDNTPDDESDPGAFIQSATVLVNGREIEARSDTTTWFQRAFTLASDDVFAPREVVCPPPQNGFRPLVMQFDLARQNWNFVGASYDSSKNVLIQRIEVRFGLSGNYRLSVLTGQQNVDSLYAGVNQQPLKFTEPLIERRTVARPNHNLNMSRQEFENWVSTSLQNDFSGHLGLNNTVVVTYSWYQR